MQATHYLTYNLYPLRVIRLGSSYGEVHVFLLYFFESRLSSQFSFSTGVSPVLSLLPCIDLVSEADKGLPDEGAIFETHDPTSTEKELVVASFICMQENCNILWHSRWHSTMFRWGTLWLIDWGVHTHQAFMELVYQPSFSSTFP